MNNPILINKTMFYPIALFCLVLLWLYHVTKIIYSFYDYLATSEIFGDAIPKPDFTKYIQPINFMIICFMATKHYIYILMLLLYVLNMIVYAVNINMSGQVASSLHTVILFVLHMILLIIVLNDITLISTLMFAYVCMMFSQNVQ